MRHVAEGVIGQHADAVVAQVAREAKQEGHTFLRVVAEGGPARRSRVPSALPSTHPTTLLSFHPTIYLPTHPSNLSSSLPFFSSLPSFHLTICSSIDLPTYSSTYLVIQMFFF